MTLIIKKTKEYPLEIAIPILEEDGRPKDNSLAIRVFDDPENYKDKYEIL